MKHGFMNWLKAKLFQSEREQHLMQLAAISTAAWGNTDSVRADRIGKDSPWWSTAYRDVCNAIDREIQHRNRVEELENEAVALRLKLESAQSELDTFKRGFAAMQEATLKQVQQLRPQWRTEFSDDAPKWEREHAEAWKVFLAQNTAGRTLQRVANFMEQQTNRSAVHRTSGAEQNTGYARGWHDATNYFFRQLSADPKPQSGTDTQATNEADALRERLASG